MLKRHRSSDHNSDSDTEKHRPKQQPRDRPASTSSHPQQTAHGPVQIKGSPTDADYDRPLTGPQPRRPDEHKSTPHLSPSASDPAANRRADSIREWHRVHTTPIASNHSYKHPSASSSPNNHLPSNTPDTKDPAVPHPADDHLRTQPPHYTPPPAESYTLNSVTSFGGYHSAPAAPPPRPTLTSILKSHKDAPFPAFNCLSASHKNDQQTPHNTDPPLRQQRLSSTKSPSRHQFLPILPHRHSTAFRPYISAPRPHDVDGTPWCDACTAQLSDDDLNTPAGLRDPDLPKIR